MQEKLVKLPGASSAMIVLVEDEIPGTLRFQGSVATTSNLPNYTEDKEKHLGEFYLVEENSAEYVYTKKLVDEAYVYSWDELGSTIDLSPYATLESPVFTGAPKAPTPTYESDDTAVATKKYVDDSTPDLTPYAPLASPVFTGTPKAPTPTSESKDTSLATTEFVDGSLFDYQQGDITDWTEATLPESTLWQSVAYGNGKFVAIAYSGNKGAYSADGKTWTEIDLPSSGQWTQITYGNGKFVAIKNNSNKGAISTDGINWAEITLTRSRSWRSVTYGNGKFVAIESIGIGNISSDGVTWTEITLPSLSSGSTWQSVTYGNGKFVAVSGTTKGAISNDGVTWTAITLPKSGNYAPYFVSVTYGNGKFVAVSSSTEAEVKGAYSTDGVNWTVITFPETRKWSAVTYGNGKFIAITSNSDKGAYSTDGITWTEITLPYSGYWKSIVYGDGIFVAVIYNYDKSYYAIDLIKSQKYAPLASPMFTGTPTAPTPTSSSDDTAVATKKYVDDAIDESVKSADWNADQGEAGYILNRPFYDKDVTTPFYQGSADFSSLDNIWSSDGNWITVSEFNNILLEDPEFCTVNVQGKGSVTIPKYMSGADYITFRNGASGDDQVLIQLDGTVTVFVSVLKSEFDEDLGDGETITLSYGKPGVEPLNPKYLVQEDDVTFNLTINSSWTSITSITCNKTFAQLMSYYNEMKQLGHYFYKSRNTVQPDEDYYAKLNVRLIVNGDEFKNVPYTIRKLWRSGSSDYALSIEQIGPPRFIRTGEVYGGNQEGTITQEWFAFAVKPDNGLVASWFSFESYYDGQITYGQLSD